MGEKAERAARAIYAVIVLLFIAAVVVITDAPAAPGERRGLWLGTLVILVLAAFFFEPNYSGTAAALANAVAGAFIAVGSQFDPFRAWWIGFAIVAAVVGVALVAERFVASDNHETPLASTLRAVGMGLGTWRVLLVAGLALSLASFIRPFESPWGISLLTLLITVALLQLRPHRFFARDRIAALRVASVWPPAEVLVDAAGTNLTVGDALRITAEDGASTEGLVVAKSYADGLAAFRVYVPDLFRIRRTGDAENLGVEASAEPNSIWIPRVRDDVVTGRAPVVGLTTEGTSMQELKIETAESVSLGELLWTNDDDDRVYWQVTGAVVRRSSWSGQTRRQVVADAVQLGTWVDESMSFVDRVTSPEEIQVALTGDDVGPESRDIPPGCLKVGVVPGTQFPVIADLRELALHHAALLGVTGTGKTHLSFELVSALAESGTRVVCVDTTGQYRRRFDQEECPEVPIANVVDFVSQDGGGIALASLDPDVFSVLQARQLANLLFAWSKKQPALEDDEPARCVLLFEEAQNFVPEWFVLDNNAHKVAAQETSRVIMESRKFGLGFVLVSQRTAMVTKSALSQCNTIFAFQAVDETSLDYFEGLCGRTLAAGLPNLPSRVAISMGRGLLSTRPLIMRTNDAAVVIK